MLTPQQKIEILEKIITHFEKQGRKANEGTSCKYRTLTGDSCAIGCLIPDDKYDPEMDNNFGATAIRENYRVRKALEDLGYPMDANSLLWYSDLQGLHDCCGDIQEALVHYRERLTFIRNKLTPPAAPGA